MCRLLIFFFVSVTLRLTQVNSLCIHGVSPCGYLMIKYKRVNILKDLIFFEHRHRLPCGIEWFCIGKTNWKHTEESRSPLCRDNLEKTTKMFTDNFTLLDCIEKVVV
jgi:hypothetical protein